MTTGYHPLPPFQLHSSTEYSYQDTVTFLEDYVQIAGGNAALQPNAILTERGPVSAPHGGRTSLALFNIQRIISNLKGEEAPVATVLEEELELAEPTELGGEGLDEQQSPKKRQRRDKAVKDPETYEQEQEVEGANELEAEIAEQGGHVDPDHPREPPRVQQANGAAPIDKELRKKLKKERREKEKKQKLQEDKARREQDRYPG